MYVANISKFSDTYTVNRKKVVTTSAYPILILPSSSQPIIAYYHLLLPAIKKAAYTLRASCDIITALSPAVSVRRRLFPSVTLSKPCAMARRTSSIEKSPSGPISTVRSSAEEGVSASVCLRSCEDRTAGETQLMAEKKSAREISG